MMKSYSVHKLNSICKKKEIWCWGCGRRFHEMIELYENEPFIGCISVLIDQNPKLWNIEIQINARNLLVQSYYDVKGRWNRNVIILITSDSYEEIHDFLMKESSIPNALCSRYPQIYFTYTTLIQVLCSRLPLRRQFLFSAGTEPHENALAIVDYLENRYEGRLYRLVFLGDTNKEIQSVRMKVLYLDSNTLRCKNNLFQILHFCWIYSVSKVLFYENQPLQKMNRKQILIFLNHGAIPMKDVHDVLKQPEMIDYALCPSQACTSLYEKQYGISKEKLIYAMPPRDIFLGQSQHRLNKVINHENRQVILWLPTFRTLKESERKDSVSENALSLLSMEKNNIRAVNERLQRNEQLLLIKYHPREKWIENIPESCNSIRVLREEELAETGIVLHEILGDTAALLTDYSGIAFEYLLLGRPIGYVVNDMDVYTRGFAFENPKDYMPGPLINSREELLRFFDDVREGQDVYHEARRQLAAKLFQGNESVEGSWKLLRKLDCLD